VYGIISHLTKKPVKTRLSVNQPTGRIKDHMRGSVVDVAGLWYDVRKCDGCSMRTRNLAIFNLLLALVMISVGMIACADEESEITPTVVIESTPTPDLSPPPTAMTEDGTLQPDSDLYPAIKNGTPTPDPTPDIVTEEEALQFDASLYAEDQDITIEEAIERLSLQSDVGKLDALLTENEKETFAGLWIQHEPYYAIIVAFTEGGQQTIHKYVAPGPLASAIEIRTFDTTLAELRGSQVSISDELQELGIRHASGINVFNNQVEIYVLDIKAADEALNQAGIELPDYVTLVEVRGFSIPL